MTHPHPGDRPLPSWPHVDAPAWFYESGNRYPAIVTAVHGPAMVNVTYEYGGSAISRTSVVAIPSTGPAPSGRTYAMQPASDDSVDVDHIRQLMGGGQPANNDAQSDGA